MDAAREPHGPGEAASDRWMERPVLVGPDRAGRRAAADRAGRAARLAASWRLGDLQFAGLAWNERLLVRQRHVHRVSFRRGRAGVGRAPAMPFSTRPTIRARARSAGHW